jgi:hypothetical protein
MQRGPCPAAAVAEDTPSGSRTRFMSVFGTGVSYP